MPFNIELMSTQKVVVKMQVLKKSIVVYFKGKNDFLVEDLSEEELMPRAVEARKDWGKIDNKIVFRIPEFIPYTAIETKIKHIKQAHSNKRETKIIHVHIAFKSEVTPKILANYLNEFLKEQLSNPNNVQFFQDAKEVEDIIETFTEYYQNFKGSTQEAIYEEANKLTPEEQKKQDEKEAKAKKRQDPFKSMANLLITQSMLFNNKLNATPTPPDNVDCYVM